MPFKAAVLKSKNAPLVVESVADMPSLGADEILVKNYAIASNPVDCIMQKGFIVAEDAYPTVVGLDHSGIVEEIGSGVTRFKKGDRVATFNSCLRKGNKYGAFQEYTVAEELVTFKIPDSISFEQAATIPLAIGTAATALYYDLALPRPGDSKNQSETIVILGGSSSVGAFAVQLATLSGYKVITTASKHNHAYVTSLGVHTVLDQNDPDIVAQIRKAAGGPPRLILDAISYPETIKQSWEIAADGAVVAVVRQFTGEPGRGIKCTFCSSWTLFDPKGKDLSDWFFGRYIQVALQEKKIQPNKVLSVDGWIDGVESMLRIHEKGVSGQKPVVHRS